MTFRNAFIKVLRTAIAPEILFWGLPALMVLVVLGTVAQANMGLYDAQQAYFNSFIAWIDTPYISLPVPGGLVIMGVLTLSLTIKFLFFTPWRSEKIGIFLSHLGVLLLMYGAIASAVFASEGFMVIREGGESNMVHSYHERRLLIDDGTNAIYNEVLADTPQAGLVDMAGLSVSSTQIMRHAALLEDKDGELLIDEREPDKEDEANRRAVVLDVNGKPLVLHEDMTEPATVASGEVEYRLALRRSIETLPFSVRLTDFHRDVYAGTDLAKNYMSEITVVDGEKSFPSLVQMNHPLRYQGYTFYQSSFEEAADGDVTVLNVVHNPARLFPYLGTALLAIGLLLHLCIIGFSSRNHKEA